MPVTGDGRQVSGRTIFLRDHNPDGSLKTPTPTATTPPPAAPIAAPAPAGVNPVTGERNKSGATLAARAQRDMINKLIWAVVIGGGVIGTIYVVRRYHLLSGGRA